ncbi:MAG: 30S ribosomal protein S8 [Candidatus Pacearchaeota archaeon]
MVARDWISSLLNDIMNCKKAGKYETVIVGGSKMILDVLEIMKKHGYLTKIEIEEEKFNKIKIKIGKLNECRAIKPRFSVKKDGFEKYIRRFLPARDVGIIIVSTSKGLMTHQEAIEKGMGGSLIAYCF